MSYFEQNLVMIVKFSESPVHASRLHAFTLLRKGSPPGVWSRTDSRKFYIHDIVSTARLSCRWSEGLDNHMGEYTKIHCPVVRRQYARFLLANASSVLPTSVLMKLVVKWDINVMNSWWSHLKIPNPMARPRNNRFGQTIDRLTREHRKHQCEALGDAKNALYHAI